MFSTGEGAAWLSYNCSLIEEGMMPGEVTVEAIDGNEDDKTLEALDGVGEAEDDT